MLMEDIAVRFSTYKGMELVDFAEVALPIYRITATALVQEKVALPTIEEFLLRSIYLGFERVEDLHQLLGLSLDVAKGGLSGLIRSDLIVEIEGGSVKITELGKKSAIVHSKSRPVEQQITFDYDGLVRRVCINRDSVYFSPREIKDIGLTEIRAIPARRPNEEEIDLREVMNFISSYTNIKDSNKTLLRVRKISRAIRLFYKAVMLVYKEIETGKYEAIYCIDGQISESHGLAFDKSNGLEKLGFLKQFRDGSKESIDKAYSKFIPVIRLKKATIKRKLLQLKNKSAGKTHYVNKSVEKSQDITVKIVPVHEHPKLLLDSIKDAKQRLIIISPWITGAVVNDGFLSTLENLLIRGAEVKIGYGYGGVKNKDEKTEKKLKTISQKYNNFTFKYLGDTHAKILIKDDDFYVITSFNWLSFKGDPNRTFREEWGNYVSDPEKVNELYAVISERFTQ